MRPALRHIFLFVLLAAALQACSLVDEDMRDCETDYNLDYELRLVTNMTTELQTQLSMEMAADVVVSNTLKTQLSKIFTDYAHDVDLGFYDVQGDSTILHHESHIMNANQSSYTLYIPVRRYMHLASANVEENPSLSVVNGDICHKAQLMQEVRDTVPSHTAGCFTARLPMDVLEGVDQQFDVRLYMVNCATAVLVDTVGTGLRDVKVFLSGMATSFDLCDSVYHFNYNPIVRSNVVPMLESPGRTCSVAVSFPSRQPEDSKVIIDIDDPYATVGGGAASLWQIRLYCTLPNGTVTETILGMTRPLHAGQFKLLKAKARPNGIIDPGDPSVVVVSVEQEWAPGLEIPVDL